jgi:hypothetical protein
VRDVIAARPRRNERERDTEAVPAEAVPAEAVPAEAVPAEAAPAEAVPAEAVVGTRGRDRGSSRGNTPRTTALSP